MCLEGDILRVTAAARSNEGAPKGLVDAVNKRDDVQRMAETHVRCGALCPLQGHFVLVSGNEIELILF